jgi:hypothetical protein
MNTEGEVRDAQLCKKAKLGQPQFDDGDKAGPAPSRDVSTAVDLRFAKLNPRST